MRNTSNTKAIETSDTSNKKGSRFEKSFRVSGCVSNELFNIRSFLSDVRAQLEIAIDKVLRTTNEMNTTNDIEEV